MGALWSHAPALFDRLCGVMRWADLVFWKKLDQLNREVVFPDLEYVLYDARVTALATNRHVDSNSAVTMIILLSDDKDFEGGINMFASSGAPSAQPRFVKMRKGDAILFRGE